MTADERAKDLFARFKAERSKLDGKPLTEDRWLAIASEAFRDASRKKKSEPKGPRPRNPLFDALAVACGHTLAEMGPAAAKTIGSALADIRNATPKVTAEEITRRALLVMRKYEKAGPYAVAVHWSEFPPPKSTKPNVYVEPADWQPTAIRLFGKDVGQRMIDSGWAEIRTNYGAQIIRAMTP